jgi:hypothetical protein
VVVHEVDAGGAFFIVVDGAACVSIDGVIVSAVHAGDVFGEVALLRGAPRSATVVAATDLHCLLLTSWHLAGFLAAHEAVARTLRVQALRYAAWAAARGTDLRALALPASLTPPRFAGTTTARHRAQQPGPAETDQRNVGYLDPLKPAARQGSSGLGRPTAHSRDLTREAAHALGGSDGDSNPR